MTREQKKIRPTAMKVAYDTYALIRRVGARNMLRRMANLYCGYGGRKKLSIYQTTILLSKPLAETTFGPSKTPMRGTVIKNYLAACIHHADSIRNASQEVKSLAHKKRLY
jgi:hypothetical protein